MAAGKRFFVGTPNAGQQPKPAAPPTLEAERGAVRLRGNARGGGGGGGVARDEEETWITTYLDVMTLLLTFLVVLVANANFDEPGPAPQLVLPEGVMQIAPLGDAVIADLTARVRLAVAAADLPGIVQVESDGNDLRIRLPNDVLFASGSAELEQPGHDLIQRLAQVFAPVDRPISVEGHSDNVPIATPRFPSNWYLSSARADAVVEVLAAFGVAPPRLRAIGYADTRPVAGNDSAEGRAANRRVTILVHPAGGF